MYFLFLIIWIIFNGQFTWEILGFGVVISAVIYAFLCRFLGFSFQTDLAIIRRIPGFVEYFCVLLIEILKANRACMGYLFSTKKEIEPLLVTFRVPLRTTAARVALANSITLTPGTITVSVEEDIFRVYCLDKELSDGLADGIFVQKLMKLEEKR